MTLSAAAGETLLAFADDEHLMGQQHTEWIGVAPFLEEDLAFSSIAQDELGHAASLYSLLGDPDALAYRPPVEYRSCHLVELPAPDWADALVRHWLYDLAEPRRWAALQGSSVVEVAALVARAEREETYHRRHAGALLTRMRDSSSADRIGAALDALLPFADALWEPVAGEADAVAEGVVTASSAELRTAWRSDVEAVVGPVAWDTFTSPDQQARSRRSDHFAALHARISEVIALDPTATW